MLCNYQRINVINTPFKPHACIALRPLVIIQPEKIPRDITQLHSIERNLRSAVTKGENDSGGNWRQPLWQQLGLSARQRPLKT